MADPVTLAAAASRVLTYASIAFGGGSLSKQEKRALEASGARGIRGAFRLPDGSMVSRDRAIAIGSAILAGASPPIAPPATPPQTIDNSPKRRRTPGGPGYRPPSWQPSPLPRPFEWPTTDADIADWERSAGVPSQGFVGPVPTIPDTLPQTLPTTVASTAARVLARVLGLPFLIFFPSETADDDTLPELLPQPLPRGPTRRPRIRTTPRAPETEPPEGVRQPRFPGDPTTRSTPTPDPTILTVPQPDPIPLPTSWPQPVPVPAPTPTPTPTPWPYLLPLLFPTPAVRPTPQPFANPPAAQPNPLYPGEPAPGTPPGTSPLTYTQPLRLPFQQPLPNDPCSGRAQRPKRRRKRRTVCYSGTYRDRATGLSKTRQRKIKCR